MSDRLLDDLRSRSADLVGEGLFKTERVLDSPQSAYIRCRRLDRAQPVRQQLPRLAEHPDIVAAAHHDDGYGMASVRFIWRHAHGAQGAEARLSAFGTDDTTCTRRASTPTVVCSRRSSTSRMP
jgi:glycine C-acetyltransferase